jgi:hypothetical protein
MPEVHRLPLIAAAATVVAILAADARACEDEPPPPPIRRELVKRDHERWGFVELSTGERVDGLVSTTRNKRLRIYDRKKSGYRDLKWRKIARIEQRPDKVWLEREWRWKEGGSDKKVYTDRYYRAAKYRTTIELKSGEVIVGDAVVPIYVKTGEKRHRLELHKRFKNTKPARKDDLPELVYIRRLVLTDKPPAKDTKQERDGGDDEEKGNSAS